MRREPINAVMTVLLVGLVTGVSTNAQAQDDLRTSFMDACALEFEELNPIWSDEQVARMCECRFELLSANFSRQDIATLTRGITDRALMQLPQDVRSANTEFVTSCFDEAN